MAERAPTNNVIPSSSSSTPSTVKIPDSDVSPKTSAPAKSDDCFGTDAAGKKQLQVATAGQDAHPKIDAPPSSSTSTAPSTATSGSAAAPDSSTDSRRPSYNDNRMLSRKSSSASVSFRSPRNPSLPQGLPRKTDNRRLRESSPSPVKFRQHVAFDNVQYGEATKNNALSFTLHARHQGYQPSRRSRTFMVGVDEHAYSDYALVWLLNNMVDDGDEVVCVRVLEAPPKSGTTNYQDDAKKLMRTIQEKNEQNKAISIVLEYAVGKLHATFQQLLHVHQPSMLVVGTKGRSLGGFQGLMNTRNSFSKYCLQYSPVPVVVVRPDDKRQKKKDKRTHDPSRQSYANMLAHNAGKHEADSETSSLYELEKGISPDEEAHRVAAAIGLPAAFDPTIKPYMPNHPARSSSNVHSPATTDTRSASPHPTNYTNDSGDEDSGDDDDEFEVEAVSAQQLVRGKEKQTELEREQKERLHQMEVGEAAALLKSKQSESNDDDDDDDESQDKASKK